MISQRRTGPYSALSTSSTLWMLLAELPIKGLAVIPPWRLAPSATSPLDIMSWRLRPTSSHRRVWSGRRNQISLGIQLIMRAPRAGLVFALNQSAQQIRGANSSAMISPSWNAPSRPG